MHGTNFFQVEQLFDFAYKNKKAKNGIIIN